MKVTLTSRNQITIPKDLIKSLNIKPGQIFDLIVDDEGIKLNYATELNESSAQIKVSSKSSLKIVSNIEESKNYSRRVISECGLLVRTKKSYLDRVCSECRGMLAKQYGESNHPCKYNISNTDKNDSKNDNDNNICSSTKIKTQDTNQKINKTENVLIDLKSNIEKLQRNIDNDIKCIQKEFP